MRRRLPVCPKGGCLLRAGGHGLGDPEGASGIRKARRGIGGRQRDLAGAGGTCKGAGGIGRPQGLACVRATVVAQGRRRHQCLWPPARGGLAPSLWPGPRSNGTGCDAKGGISACGRRIAAGPRGGCGLSGDDCTRLVGMTLARGVSKWRFTTAWTGALAASNGGQGRGAQAAATGSGTMVRARFDSTWPTARLVASRDGCDSSLTSDRCRSLICACRGPLRLDHSLAVTRTRDESPRGPV